MKNNAMRWVTLALAAALAVSVTACGKKNPQSGSASASTSAEQTQQTAVIGPWRLNQEKNDQKVMAEKYPAYAELGAGMEIIDETSLSWFIGSAGGSGTYTRTGNVITAEMIADVDGKTFTVTLTCEEEKELVMTYDGQTIYWTAGDYTKDDPANGGDASKGDTSAPAQKPVKPDPGFIKEPEKKPSQPVKVPQNVDVVKEVKVCDDQGDMVILYQQTPERYVDDQNNVYIFNGSDTWTDASGVEWLEILR